MAEGATFSRGSRFFYYSRLPSGVWQFLLGLLVTGFGSGIQGWLFTR